MVLLKKFLQTVKKTPQEISLRFFNTWKVMLKEYSSEKVTKAVITVPAYFNDAQRQATKDVWVKSLVLK